MSRMISQFFCNLNSSNHFTCPLRKLRPEFTSLIAKSTSPRLLNTSFFACCPRQVPFKFTCPKGKGLSKSSSSLLLYLIVLNYHYHFFPFSLSYMDSSFYLVEKLKELPYWNKGFYLSKSLTKKNKKWPWPRKIWELLAQRTCQNSNFSKPVGMWKQVLVHPPLHQHCWVGLEYWKVPKPKQW